MHGVTLIELTVVLLVLIALAGVTIPMFSGTPSYAQCVATDATMANIRDAIMGSGGMAGYRNDNRSPYEGMPLDNGTTTPSSLNALFNNTVASGVTTPIPSFNLTTQRGWRGPYISGGITCAEIAGKIPTGYTPTIDNENVCHLSGAPNLYTVALDSFPAFATNTTTGDTTIILPGSPIVLMKDTNGNYFLVSGGATGGIETDPNRSLNPTNMATRNNDDRVLYLDTPDPAGGNLSCSQ